MTGMTSLTSSPSSVTTSRSTPCVRGCCGPMLTTTSLKARPSTSEPSPRAVDSSMRRRASLTASSGSGVANWSGMRVVLHEVDVVLAQRVPDEVVLEQDATQVGMTDVPDARPCPTPRARASRRPATRRSRCRPRPSAVGTSTCSSRYVLVFQEYTWYTLSRCLTRSTPGHEVERLVADLGVRLEAPRHVLERGAVAARHDGVGLLHAHVRELGGEVGAPDARRWRRCPWGSSPISRPTVRRLRPWPAAGGLGDELVLLDLDLQLQQPLEQRLGARRAAGDVDVDGHDLVDPVDHVVAVVERARRWWRRRPC